MNLKQPDYSTRVLEIVSLRPWKKMVIKDLAQTAYMQFSKHHLHHHATKRKQSLWVNVGPRDHRMLHRRSRIETCSRSIPLTWIWWMNHPSPPSSWAQLTIQITNKGQVRKLLQTLLKWWLKSILRSGHEFVSLITSRSMERQSSLQMRIIAWINRITLRCWTSSELIAI